MGVIPLGRSCNLRTRMRPGGISAWNRKKPIASPAAITPRTGPLGRPQASTHPGRDNERPANRARPPPHHRLRGGQVSSFKQDHPSPPLLPSGNAAAVTRRGCRTAPPPKVSVGSRRTQPRWPEGEQRRRTLHRNKNLWHCLDTPVRRSWQGTRVDHVQAHVVVCSEGPRIRNEK